MITVKSAIIVAAGSSSRMGGKVRKPYLTLRGKPILAWAIQAVAKVAGLKQIVLVTRPEDRGRASAAAKAARLPKRIRVDFADGGPRRQDSVYNGLKAVVPEAAVVLIHDAARPFPERDAMAKACDVAFADGAAILACRVKDTVKRESATTSSSLAARHAPPVTLETVPRERLWRAQTPQVFRRALILELFERLAREAPDHEVTDDAAVCELFRHPVALVEASETNIKVTRPEDLRVAEAYLKAGLV
ncbi:MAG: 2-C-methyl-D-erythritol 4-phosphate cytidylyltransferase [Planctomycetota bacterium]|nr:2-C-methyl-D-erythritol 4-phosphate cytidylyltransferase [Planctomycetota bacterium]